jgi:hypothetical protein
MFLLFNIIIELVLRGIEGRASGLGVLESIYGLVVLIPSIAVSVRRLHDTDRSGWWLLIVLIPLIGAIVLLVFMAQDSQPGANQYGPNPKGVDKPQDIPGHLPATCPSCRHEWMGHWDASIKDRECPVCHKRWRVT